MWASLTQPGNYQQSEQVFGALRDAASGVWGATETISPRERAEQPRAAFEPVGGKPAVVWSAQPGAPPLGQQPYQLPEALRIATRG